MLKELESTRLPSTKTKLSHVPGWYAEFVPEPLPHLSIRPSYDRKEMVHVIPLSLEHPHREVRRYVEPRQLHRTSPFR